MNIKAFAEHKFIKNPLQRKIDLKIHKKSVAYSAAQLTLSSLVLQMLGFIYRIGMSRLAGAEGVGVYHLIMPVYSLMQSLTLSGITLGVSTISAEECAVGGVSYVPKLVKTAISIFFALFFVLCIFLVPLCDSVSFLLCGSDMCKTALLLMLPCLFLTGIENIIKNCFYGIRSLKPPIFSEILEHTVRIAAVFALLSLFATSYSPAFSAALIFSGMTVGELASSSSLSFIYLKTAAKKRKPTSKKFLLKILKIAVPVTAAGVLNNLIAFFTTVLIPKRLIFSGMSLDAAMSSFGVMFGMTFPLLMLPSAFLNPLMTVLIPRFSAGTALNDSSLLKRKTAKALHTTSLILCACLSFLLPLCRPICKMLYNRADAADFFFPLSVSTALLFYQIVTAGILNGMELQKKSCLSVIVSGIVELAATYFLVALPSVRLYGYVIACVLSSAVGCAMNLVFVKRAVKFKVQWRNWLFIPYSSMFISALFCRFVYHFLAQNNIFEPLSVICAITTALLSYLALLRLQGCDFISYLKKITTRCV